MSGRAAGTLKGAQAVAGAMRGYRPRYIAVVAEPALPLETRLLAALRALPPLEGEAARTRFYPVRAGAGIVRVDHRHQEAARALLQGLEVGGAALRTVTTSGTLRQARRALGLRTSARRRRRPPRARRGAPEKGRGPRGGRGPAPPNP